MSHSPCWQCKRKQNAAKDILAYFSGTGEASAVCFVWCIFFASSPENNKNDTHLNPFFPILAVCQRFCAVGCFQYLKFEPSVIVSNIWIFDCFQDLNIWAPFGCFWYLNIWAPFSCFQYLDIWAHFVVSNIWNLSLPAWWGWSWSRLFLDHNCFPLLPMAQRGQTCHEISK